MVNKLKNIIRASVRRVLDIRRKRNLQNRILWERNVEEYQVMKNLLLDKRTALTEIEMERVKCLWGGVVTLYSYQEYEVFKNIRGFDERYLSHNIYLPLISHRLNNYRYTKLFEHKSLLGRLTYSNIRFPECIVRCIDGEYYTSDMHQIDIKEAMDLCINNGGVLIVKDSAETSGGRSVEKINLGNLDQKEQTEKIKNAFEQRRNDFVIQKCIKQHLDMAKFNPSSVNTIRLTTLYLNGVFSVCSICLRMGKQGMTTDNLNSGGIMVGVDATGKLSEVGYDLSLNEYSGQNGIVFRDSCIKQIPSIIKMLEESHSTDFSLCKFIGWDVCISEDGEPLVIELNSSQPGLFGEQICDGPIFGDRTQEVIDYCCSKQVQL